MGALVAWGRGFHERKGEAVAMPGSVQLVAGEDGRVVVQDCTLADRFLSRLRGLLGRRGLGAGEGLLLSPSSSVHTLFMRFPIDVIFLDRGLRVVGVSPDVRPWRLRGRLGARHVLELPAGEAEARGLRVGERLALAGAAGMGGSTWTISRSRWSRGRG